MSQLLVDLSTLSQSANIPPTFDQQSLARLLEPDSPRYLHTCGVVEEMEQLCKKLSFTTEMWHQLIQAAFLHDIGYSNRLQQTAFHPVDGAIFAQEQGFSKPIVAAILFHSEAKRTWSIPSNIVNLYEQNHAYLDATDRLFIDLVTYCDLHRSPLGEHVTVEERITEIISRYGSDHSISQQILYNMKYLLITCDHVKKYLATSSKDKTV